MLIAARERSRTIAAAAPAGIGAIRAAALARAVTRALAGARASCLGNLGARGITGVASGPLGGQSRVYLWLRPRPNLWWSSTCGDSGRACRAARLRAVRRVIVLVPVHEAVAAACLARPGARIVLLMKNRAWKRHRAPPVRQHRDLFHHPPLFAFAGALGLRILS
jgi:hypothetical protein